MVLMLMMRGASARACSRMQLASFAPAGLLTVGKERSAV